MCGPCSRMRSATTSPCSSGQSLAATLIDCHSTMAGLSRCAGPVRIPSQGYQVIARSPSITNGLPVRSATIPSILPRYRFGSTTDVSTSTVVTSSSTIPPRIIAVHLAIRTAPPHPPPDSATDSSYTDGRRWEVLRGLATMTYCVGMLLDTGLVFLSDSRTSAGVDHISTFRKTTVFQRPGDRVLVIQTAGNLAITQAVISF